jgi:galactosylceramidase
LILSNHDDRKGGERLLSESKIEGFSALNWHKLTLRMDGNRIIGLVDGQEVLSSRSDQYPHGMAGLIAPFRSGGISTPYFDNLEIKPLGKTVHVDARDVNINPLY